MAKLRITREYEVPDLRIFRSALGWHDIKTYEDLRNCLEYFSDEDLENTLGLPINDSVEIIIGGDK